jgi:hypothetical protein
MVTKERQLAHLDRLIIGTNAYFLVKIPGAPELNNAINVEEVDCDFAQRELMQKSEELKKIRNQNMERQRQKEGDQFDKKKIP